VRFYPTRIRQNHHSHKMDLFRDTRVLVVILYLAASGVGKITVVDFDEVETANLHRQIIHNTHVVGKNKAVSACRAVQALNPTISCTPIQVPFTHENAVELVSSHDCIVDATDNPRTRYLINDACVLTKKPLVSGSAIGTEGQISVYQYNGGSCYRCLYPKPNPTEGCKSCSDHGVLGTVPGLIGILQATETIKVLSGIGCVYLICRGLYKILKPFFLTFSLPRTFLTELPCRIDCLCMMHFAVRF
jgi:adenylyltransferase/sulfurtransferase